MTVAEGAVRRIGLIALLALGCSMLHGSASAQKPMTPEQETLSNLEKALPTDSSRFFKLSEVASAAFNAGDYDKAESYAVELLSDAESHRTNWNFGNAIYYGNLIQGRVALKRDNNISQAESFLLAAGRTPGSPQLNNFGPNMTLAKDLLIAGERDVVLEFIDECRKFWKTGADRLDDWKKAIQSGETPQFGHNMNYF